MPKEQPAAKVEPEGEPLRGAAARIVANMEASLEVPTATSFREVPAKLLEVNRRVINGYLGRTRGGKVSFTHLIGYAVVQALAGRRPRMNSTFVEGADGKPRVVRHEHVGLGLAVDVEKSDGSRTLLVPVIKDADTLDFRGFWAAYEELIRKVRTNKLAADDFAGATVTLTNPGTIGTVQSVPRLMPGQGVIVGVGRLDYPAAFQGADPADARRARRVEGHDGHLDLRPPHHPGRRVGPVPQARARAAHRRGRLLRAASSGPSACPTRRCGGCATTTRSTTSDIRLEKQMQVQTLINMHRVRGHLIADLDPLAWKEPHMHTELDPATYGLTIWDLDREFLTGGVAGTEQMKLGDLLHVLRDAYCRTIGIEYMHIPEPDAEAVDPGARRGRDARRCRPDEQRHILGRLNAAEAFEKFLGTKYVGQKRFGIEGAESRHPAARRHPRARPPTTSSTARCMGMAHRGRLNVLANIVGKSYDQLFKEFEGYIDPESTQGSGDVKYHLGQTGKFAEPHRQRRSRRAGRQPVAPRGRRPGRRGHGAGQAGPHQRPRGLLGAAAADPRRRRLRRPGRGGRDAQPARPSRATGSAARST